MDKMSIWTILFVSFPEELLIVLTTLVLIGYKDFLNFKKSENIFRLLFSVILMVIFACTGRMLLPSISLNSLVSFIAFTLILTITYRIRLLSSFFSILTAFIVIIVGESTLLVAIMKLFNISLQVFLTNDAIRILVTLPERLLQIMIILIISRIKNTNFNKISLSIDEWIQISLFSMVIIGSMISIEAGFKNINHDHYTITNLIINICITISFSAWTIYKIFKIRKKTIISNRIRDFELKRIKKLLIEGYTNHVIELIDSTLKERRNKE